MADRDLDSNEIIQIAKQKVSGVQKLLQHEGNNGWSGSKSHDSGSLLAKQVQDTFRWLYANALYGASFDLIKLLPAPCYSWFEFIDFPNLVHVTDKYGSSDNLLDLFMAFAANETVPQLLSLSVHKDDCLISSLLGLYQSSPGDALRVIDSIIVQSQNHIGSESFNSLFTKICAYKLRFSRDSSFNDQLSIKLLTSVVPKNQYSFDLVRQIYETNASSKNMNELVLIMKSLVDDKTVDHSTKQSMIFAAFKHGSKYLLKSLCLWTLLFPDVELNYDATSEEMLILKNRWMFHKEVDLDSVAEIDNSCLSRLVSVLIYGHTRWGRRGYVSELYSYKKMHHLQITRADQVGVLRSLVHIGKYDEALQFTNICSKQDDQFVCSETYDSIFLSLAKAGRWNDLKDKFDYLFDKEQITTIKQYSVMFMVLASRGATKYLLDLWDSFLKRGFTPDDMILSSIIFCFIKTKSYTKALQWFSAYSYYKVPLTAKSYGLMLNALSSTHDFRSCFRMLDELVEKHYSLNSFQMQPFLRQCAFLGDHRSIELILSNYFPLLGISVESKDSRWILKAHYFGNRFGTVVESYEQKLESGDYIDYQDTLLALEAASKYTNVSKFYELWEKALKMHTNEMTVGAYILYIGVNVRVHGLYGVEQVLDEVQQKFKLKYLPAKVFNEMIFSSIRMGRPWYSPTIVKMALTRGVVPTSKTYSLLLQSNTSLYSYSEQHIEETIQLLDEILLNRKKDKLGKLDRDLNPMSFKLVIMHIIKFKGVEEARKYFELYVEDSKDYLLDNLHVLHIELLLLGEESRWEEFSGCYDRFTSILKSRLQYARLKGNEDLYDDSDHKRVEQFYRYPTSISVNENRISYSRSPSVGIPSSLKKALFTIWPYRLRQLAELEQLDEMTSIVDRLYENGFILSNKNLNETALVLSSHNNLIPETVAFINKYILPGHMLHKRLALIKMKYKSEYIPFVHEPEIRFINSIYFQIMKNIDSILDSRLTPPQKDALLDSIIISDTMTVMKNLRSISRSQRFVARVFAQTRKQARSFYRRNHANVKMRRQQEEKIVRCEKIDKMINYRQRWLALRQRKWDLMTEMNKTADESERYQLLNEMSKVKTGFEELRADQKNALETLKREKLKIVTLEDSKVFKVGRINLYKLHSKVALDVSSLIEESKTRDD
ncbi:hypothetical protein FOA43_000544 [Brettanomyces nanus]|uniref:Uncharacterized protein n=1 Tax=Eeniella nana TaxID=13502 RepID=A0A875RT79_EENNA|nr:uncharacterized protein FOA43_000544 [Brettanomyces nanus]QPG73237.1 hypothetical protein FOA43_000544 [Brettanomyces nanus]